MMANRRISFITRKGVISYNCLAVNIVTNISWQSKLVRRLLTHCVCGCLFFPPPFLWMPVELIVEV